MPVSFNSPARNLFLLGSTGDIIANFFKTIDQSSGTDNVYIPDEIRYNYSDENFLLAGSAEDINSKKFGWFEKRNLSGTADWDVRVEATTSANTTLRAMELDANDNLIVVGKTADIPWIAKYSNGGVIDWQSTTNSADVEYTGITSDANGNYYACGNTPVAGEAQAFVEKFDASGNPGWGKSAFMLGRDVVLNKVAANTRGEVVAVGYLEDDTANKGYIVKIDTNTGEVLWDRTIDDTRDYFGNPPSLNITDVYVDDNDQIYVTGSINVISTKQFLIKYTAEGNIIWQRESGNNILSTAVNIVPVNVKSNSDTQQTVVASTYIAFGFSGLLLTSYSKDGSVIWRRLISSSHLSSNVLHSANLDADPSFYYILYTDDSINQSNGTPDRYTFGRVSTSGNGLGKFEYDEGTGEIVDYEISNLSEKIGRLSDGSVRNDTSDLITYPFNANKLLFDDLATQVANKKRQMDSADSFEYSGSPAIRPADFQELNLLGDVYSGSGNWLDQSGKGNDSTVSGATWNASGWFDLDGVNGYFRIPSNPNLNFGTGDFTYETWLWTDISNSSNYIFNLSNEVSLYSNETNFVYYSNVTGEQFFDSLPSGIWRHYVIRKSSNLVTGYQDGVKMWDANYPFASDTHNFSGASIGRGPFNLFYWDGRIGEIRIYPRALTPAQIFQNYNATKLKYTNEPPDIAPKISDKSIVYDSNLLLNYDFGNRATYETRPYPLPSNQISSTEQKITASDGAAGDRFGISVAAGSNRIVVGAPNDDDNGSDSGSAYIFDLNGNQLAKITASDSAFDDQFGRAVAVGSNRIVVGAYGDDIGSNFNQGSAYIFDLDGNQLAKITASDAAALDYFGWSVAVGSNRIVVGAFFDDDNGSSSGSAYIYDLDGTNEIKITASDGAAGDNFGRSVAVGSNRIIVGAPNDSDSGSAYIFDLNGNQLAKITASDGAASDNFGWSVAVESGKIVVGAYRDDDNGSDSGAAYIYDLDGTNEIKITASDSAAGDRFGYSVAVGSDKIVIGAYDDDDNGTVSGSAYIYDLDGTNEIKLLASDGTDSDYFGYSVAVGSNKIVVGAFLEDERGSDSGSAYIYNLGYPLPTTVKNLSSSSYTGTINGATFNSNGYFVFDGTNDGISVSSLPNFTNITVEWWGTSNYPDSNSRVPVMKTTNTSWSDGFGFYQQNGVVSWWVNQWNGTGATETQTSTTSFGFTHWVGTYDGNNVKLYRNGVLENTATYTTAMTNPNVSFDIGNSKANYYWDGNIGHVRIYTRALTATEVSQNFNATRAKYGV